MTVTDIVDDLRLVERSGDLPPRGHPTLAGRAADQIERLRAALYAIISLDHHNHGPESKATKLARAALNRAVEG